MLNAHRGEEPRWHAALAVFAALVLYATLPSKVLVGPLWLLPLLVFATLGPLLVLKPKRHEEARWQRALSIASIALLNAFNVATIVLLCIWQFSEHHRRPIASEILLRSAVDIWFTNLIVYALWYWEVDGNGPDARMHTPVSRELYRSDFLFPQMSLDAETRDRLNWKPRFVDYLFLAFAIATAFSPADTFPLTRRAKLLMMGESIASLVTVAVIAARAIGTAP
jgi:hypothetical protein